MDARLNELLHEVIGGLQSWEKYMSQLQPTWPNLHPIHCLLLGRFIFCLKTLFLFQLKHLTGSTANVYLEYIQRNLPEGVAIEVKKVPT